MTVDVGNSWREVYENMAVPAPDSGCGWSETVENGEYDGSPAVPTLTRAGIFRGVCRIGTPVRFLPGTPGPRESAVLDVLPKAVPAPRGIHTPEDNAVRDNGGGQRAE